MRVIYTADGIESLTGLNWSTAIEITSPDAFHSIDPVTVADDRRSQGGQPFARVRWSGWRGELIWTVLTQAERDQLFAWWQTTAGWRRPFALEDDDGARYLATMPTEQFPLAYVGGQPAAYSMTNPVTLTATERTAP